MIAIVERSKRAWLEHTDGIPRSSQITQCYLTVVCLPLCHSPAQQGMERISPPSKGQEQAESSTASAKANSSAQVTSPPPTQAMAGSGPRSTAGMISGLLQKLTPPKIVRDARLIPRFKETCSLQAEQPSEASQSPTSPSDAARHTTWQDHTAKATFANDFASVLGAYEPNARSLVFFGEQHHQPPVIRAQVQLLAAMSDRRQVDEHNESSTPTSPNHGQRKVRYHLHLLMEHFSVLDQPLLDSFHSGQLSVSELCAAYRQTSDEGFRMEMYAPLLLLAREKGAHIWGGFPPRDWARVAMREGIESVRVLEEQRQKGAATARHCQMPLFQSWFNVANLSRSHKTFLSALMRPDGPPRYVMPLGSDAAGDGLVYATKGFGPAQALKDSYLAHAATELLRNGHELARGVTADDRDSSPDDEHRNVVLVVAGLGHVEGGFGAPERVAEHERAKKALIVLSKPNDSGLWLGPEWDKGQTATRKAEKGEKESEIAGAGTPLHDAGWERKLADAVVLYDWVEFEAEAEGSDK